MQNTSLAMLHSDTTLPFSQIKLLNSILLELSKSKEVCVLEYEDVNPETADAVSSGLDSAEKPRISG
jgi:hypothetical protein